jgi:hypothetical protein
VRRPEYLQPLEDLGKEKWKGLQAQAEEGEEDHFLNRRRDHAARVELAGDMKVSPNEKRKRYLQADQHHEDALCDGYGSRKPTLATEQKGVDHRVKMVVLSECGSGDQKC